MSELKSGWETLDSVADQLAMAEAAAKAELAALRKDAEAFRLMVKMKMRVEIIPHIVYAGTSGDDGEDLAAEPWHKHSPSCEDATRRAIVRAAAAMGGEQ